MVPFFNRAGGWARRYRHTIGHLTDIRKNIFWHGGGNTWPAKLTTYLGSKWGAPSSHFPFLTVVAVRSLNYPLCHILLRHQSPGWIDSEIGHEFRCLPVHSLDPICTISSVAERGEGWDFTILWGVEKYAHQVKCCSGVYFLDQWFRKPNPSEDLIDTNVLLSTVPSCSICLRGPGSRIPIFVL